MKKYFIIAFVAFCHIIAIADDRYYYTGPQVRLAASQYTCELIGSLQSSPEQSLQGIDCWGEYIVAIQKDGTTSTYHYDGSTLSKVGTTSLTGFSEKSLPNECCFSSQFFANSDKMPLLFVSQSSQEKNVMKNGILLVERIVNNLKSSKLVAKIQLKEAKKLFENTLLWTIDRENNFLYGIGSTNENNKHRIVKFKLPLISTKSKNVQTILLSEKNLMENYIIEDYYPHCNQLIAQGAMVKYGFLYLPVGDGTEEQPSQLYVWDLSRRKMQNVIDLSKSTKGKVDDCAEYMGELLIQAQGVLYKIRFQ